MKEQKQLPKTLKLGDCELDVPSGIVVDGDRSSRLDPKSVDLAIYLAEHANQLVSHDQLLDAVWPNKFVSESQLSKRITEIRQALGDSQKPHRYIETLPKRGYRLVCQCEIVGDVAVSKQAIAAPASSAIGGSDQASSSQQPIEILDPKQAGSDSTSLFRHVAIAMLVIALGYFIYESRPTQETVFDAATVAEKSVAVLPFVDLSPNNDEEWYSDGLTEEIINSLAQLPELRVSSRTSSFQFRETILGIPEIAMKLGVRYVVEGSVRRDGDQLRITAQLIRAEDGFHMWSGGYDDSTEAIFDVQEDVAESIATELDVYLDGERRELMFQIGTSNAGAYEAYLQGMDIWTAWHGGPRPPEFPSAWEANVFFERAMELEPDFAVAALMHADAFIHAMVHGNDLPSLRGELNPMHSAKESQELALADLDRAIANALNPSLKLGIELQRAYFSSDWRRIPELVERLRGQINSYPWRNTDDGWLHPILNFLGEYEMARVLAEARVREDPDGLRGLRFLQDVEMLSGNLDAAQEVNSRVASLLGINNRATTFNRRWAISEGNREEVIRILESQIEGGNPNPWYPTYLAAVKGSRSEANRVAIEMTSGTLIAGQSAQWLFIYHETGNTQLSREMTQKLDAMPGGAAFLAGEILKFGNSLFFDLADAPKFVTQLRQAGLDPDLLKILPRLSKLGEVSQ